ncbi:nucleotidyltransferase family protein [Streptomyces alkaliterrae]|uniref:NTP transferase domain-containing protein n=1 Tax=Streptomyces alkaliterrae TaxID=2213162 RepID=A0A5P0YX97_9ACTN|nr:nucleotidyltransferase family protein [Streptomyces alkaliterrae]MBB1255667.1 nucleotidyltransferase family protein [Streptomyces alkaliterrae]MBB1261339.1 nucleotidyltransferase family protein [Streptomyces alkaliterrae]MQS03119.1 NTP transferase domain-containing protein [Streptomyces alkaliterrae]
MTDTAHRVRVTGLLLAAGGGRRLGGRPKALLGHHGRPLVEHAARALFEGGCERVVVVLGAEADAVLERADLADCEVVVNREWETGMGGSLRAGLRAVAAAPNPPDAALVTLTDQPGIGAEAIDRLRRAADGPHALAMAAYDGVRGHPVLLGARHWAEVAAGAEGDRGARGHLRRHAGEIVLVECADVADPADVDTPADLARLL